MKGYYLYCIRGRSNSKFSTEGIGGGKIFPVPYQDLEAVVSRVSLEEFGSKEIQKKAKEDLKWIAEKARLHEKAVEQAMRKGKGIVPVIPMKFGTIFKSKEKLEKTLKKHYKRFRETLKKLKGKQEWSVKVYLNRRAFEKELKKVSPVVQEKEKEIRTLLRKNLVSSPRSEIAQIPEGVAYFMQKQIDEAVSKEAKNALQKYVKNFFGSLRKHTEAGTKGKLLEKELTGKSLPMVLNAIFLVSEKKLKDFTKEIKYLNKEFKTKGFTFEYSGPWPPYHFV